MIEHAIQGLDLKFETNPTLFSPRELDKGSLALLSRVHIERGDKVLDLGCGYGLLGIFAAKFTRPEAVFLLDRDHIAIDYARRNVVLNDVQGITCAVSDGFHDFHEAGFTKILCNPPYHADFSVPKHFIEKGFNRLIVGGSMWMVTKREPWYRNKLGGIFGGVQVHLVGSYFVFEARKISQTYAAKRRRTALARVPLTTLRSPSPSAIGNDGSVTGGAREIAASLCARRSCVADRPNVPRSKASPRGWFRSLVFSAMISHNRKLLHAAPREGNL